MDLFIEIFLFLDKFGYFIRWNGSAKVITLNVITIIFLEKIQLVFSLNTFSHNLELQRLCKGNNGFCYHHTVRIFGDIHDK